MKAIQVIITQDVLRPPHVFLTWDTEPQRDNLKGRLRGRGAEGHRACEGQMEGSEVHIADLGKRMSSLVAQPTQT